MSRKPPTCPHKSFRNTKREPFWLAKDGKALVIPYATYASTGRIPNIYAKGAPA